MNDIVTCPRCKAEVHGDSRFCDQCSAPLGDFAAPPGSPVAVSRAVSTPMAPPPGKAAAEPATKPVVPVVKPIPTLDRPPARRGSHWPLIIGLLIVGGLFVGAVGQAALLLNSRAVAPPLPAPGLNPTAAAALIQQQATALSIQQTTTAQFQAQATRLAEQPLAFQATLTAVSLSGAGVPGVATSTVTPTRTLLPATPGPTP